MLIKLKDGRKQVSDAEAFDILANVFDPKRIVLICEKHGIRSLPTAGCRDCWLGYYVRWLAKVPRERWAEELTKLNAVVRNMADAEDKGQFDFQPFSHARIKTEKDAA